MTRQAISPRFAIKILLMGLTTGVGFLGACVA